MNGTCLSSTVAVATSAGADEGSSSARTDPSVATYDHSVFDGASQSSSVGAPRPCASVVQIHGSRCGPENTGPFFEWFVTVRVAVSSPDVTMMSLSPSGRSVTSPTAPSSDAVNASLMSWSPSST